MQLPRPLFLLIILFLIFITTSFSQSDSDSLAIKLSETSNDTLRENLILKYIELHYRNEPALCQQLATTLIEQSLKNKHVDVLAHAYSYLGVINKNKGDYSAALENHFCSERINLQKNNKKALATNYNDIGIIYKTLKEYDKALEYYKKANALTVEMEFKRGIVMTNNNIGTIYDAKKDYENAVIYFKIAFEKAIEYDILSGQSIALSNLGEVYGIKGDEQKARIYFTKAMLIDRKTGDDYGLSISYMNIAGTFKHSNSNDSALFYYNKAEEKAKFLKANQLLIDIYSNMYQVFEKAGDYKTALEKHKSYLQYQDSVYNESKAKQLAETEAKYEALKKDQEIKNLKNEQLLANIQQKQYQSERIAWISLFLIGVILIVYFYKRYQQKQIQEFNKKLLVQKESYLKAIVETQEEERKRIAKDLHDGVGQTMSGIKLALVNIVSNFPVDNESEKKKLMELVQNVDDACVEVRSISHQMMPRLLQEDGLIPSIADMLDKSFAMSDIQYNFEHFGMEKRLRENVEIGVYRICQELINNIIKHSGASSVNVQLFRNGKTMVLLVEDNGKGFEFQDKKDKGIGLLNISSRVETIHGEFNLEPSPISGTLATIRIPIDTQ